MSIMKIENEVRFYAEDPVVLEVVKNFGRRSETGVRKYGTTLARTDLTELEWRMHHQEELMDAILYNQVIINLLKEKQHEEQL